MALDLAQLAHLTLAKMTELASLPYDEWVVQQLPTWREWYQAVQARLDVAVDGEVVQLPMIWPTGFPSRFVWVDSRLRVWRTDDYGRAASVETLAN